MKNAFVTKSVNFFFSLFLEIWSFVFIMWDKCWRQVTDTCSNLSGLVGTVLRWTSHPVPGERRDTFIQKSQISPRTYIKMRPCRFYASLVDACVKKYCESFRLKYLWCLPNEIIYIWKFGRSDKFCFNQSSQLATDGPFLREWGRTSKHFPGLYRYKI